jgi:hypothetical protein
MRNRAGAAHAAFGAPDALHPINNAASPPPKIPATPLNKSFKRRDTLDAPWLPLTDFPANPAAGLVAK